MRTKKSISVIVKTKNFLKRHLEQCPKWHRQQLPKIGLGILKSGSLQLSAIGRQIKQNQESIREIENKLSRYLQSPAWDENTIVDSYLKSLKRYIKPDTNIYIDRTDYAKPYGQKMEGLGRVWDGSQKTSVLGYWGFESLAEIGDHELLPLVNYPYYLGQDKKDKSGHKLGWGFRSENEALEQGFDQIIKYFGSNGVWNEDRGFDRNDNFRYNYEHQIKATVRLKRNRILLDRENHTLGNVEDIARKAELKGLFRYKEESHHKYLSLGSIKVRIPEVPGEYTLIIIRDDNQMKACGGKVNWIDGEEREWFLALLTTLLVENAVDEEGVVRRFLKRWDIEDSCRFIKQELGGETFLVRGFRAIRRLIIIMHILMGLLFLIREMGDEMLAYLEKIGDCFKKDVDFCYYRIVWGMRKLLTEVRSP
jgi:hypothetical protein